MVQESNAERKWRLRTEARAKREASGLVWDRAGNILSLNYTKSKGNLSRKA